MKSKHTRTYRRGSYFSNQSGTRSSPSICGHSPYNSKGCFLQAGLPACCCDRHPSLLPMVLGWQCKSGAAPCRPSLLLAAPTRSAVLLRAAFHVCLAAPFPPHARGARFVQHRRSVLLRGCSVVFQEASCSRCSQSHMCFLLSLMTFFSYANSRLYCFCHFREKQPNPTLTLICFSTVSATMGGGPFLSLSPPSSILAPGEDISSQPPLLPSFLHPPQSTVKSAFASLPHPSPSAERKRWHGTVPFCHKPRDKKATFGSPLLSFLSCRWCIWEQNSINPNKEQPDAEQPFPLSPLRDTPVTYFAF